MLRGRNPDLAHDPLPAGELAGIRAAIAGVERARLTSLLRRWPRLAPGAAATRARAWMGPLDARAAGTGPVRCWIASAHEALSAIDAARTAPLSRLVEIVADAGVLADLAPRGTIPGDFRARAKTHAARRLARLAEEAPLLAAPWLPPELRPGMIEVSFAPDADLGRPGDELEIPAAGMRCSRIGRKGTLLLAREEALPPLGGLLPGPSTGAPLLAKGVRVAVGKRDESFDGRVARALSLLECAWPDAAAAVREDAWRVVPVTDPATVSYSSRRRPGILYIHRDSRPAVRLAEDLLHETVHVRVHSLEALRPIVVPRAPDGEEPRYWSPWRREWRPVRGLLHGACTFTAGAELFERMLRASGPGGPLRIAGARRLWLARRLLEERESVRFALRALAGARRDGLLTPAGRAVLDAVKRRHAALARAAAGRRRELTRTAKGRKELGHLERWRGAMERRPMRWS